MSISTVQVKRCVFSVFVAFSVLTHAFGAETTNESPASSNSHDAIVELQKSRACRIREFVQDGRTRVHVNWDSNAQLLNRLRDIGPIEALWFQCPIHEDVTSAAIVEGISDCRILNLNLRHTGATDADMESIAHISTIEVLCLAGTRVTDDGLARLAALKQLRVLYLGDTAVTGRGVANLASGLSLEEVHLEGNHVEARDLAALVKSSSLRELNLDFTDVEDDAIVALADSTKLHALSLMGSKRITSGGLAPLANMQSLRLLCLNQCSRIDDRAVMHLGQLRGLQCIDLNGPNRISARGRADLAAMLPNTTILYNCEPFQEAE